MSINVSVDSILGGVVSQLAAQLTPATGQPVSSTKPVYTVQRYMGGEFTTPEGFKRGIAGRTPALRVRHAGTKTLRTHVGRRLDRVETAISVIVASDSHRSKDDRQSLLALCESVRVLVGSRSYGLAINPLRYRETRIVRDDEQLMALAVTFTTRHRVDYSIDPGSDTFASIVGQIVNAEVTRSPKPNAPTVVMHGTAGTTHYAWAIVGVGADGKRSLISDPVVTAIGPLVPNGTDFARLSWAATVGMVSYEIHRVDSSGPVAVGLIGSTALLTFDDKNQSVISPTPIDPIHVDLQEAFT